VKIRTGFVSNSSSSSFIIFIKESDQCPHCGRMDGNFLAMLQEGYGGDDADHISASGFDEIMDNLRDGWCLTEDRISGIEEKMKKKKYQKGRLYQISLSNHRHTLEAFRDGEFKNVEIVESLG
jgi:Mg2+ and Co2+ transporter CorA